MKTNSDIVTWFQNDFDKHLSQYLLASKYISSIDEYHSMRWINRSLVPHLSELSGLFNRERDLSKMGDETDDKSTSGQNKKIGKGTSDDLLTSYWQSTSNPRNRELAYFSYYFPTNVFRLSQVLFELQRLGFDFESLYSREKKCAELGAGPGSALFAFELMHSLGSMPTRFSWDLFERRKSLVQLGKGFFESLFRTPPSQLVHETLEFTDRIRCKSDGKDPFKGKQYSMIVSSFFLNESLGDWTSATDVFLKTIEDQLIEGGLLILVEPALKIQSRKLLSLRKSLIEKSSAREKPLFEVLLPCLGNQTCGALSLEEDWCHETVRWRRPLIIERIDQSLSLNHTELPFSYLVIRKLDRNGPGLSLGRLSNSNKYQRLVSPCRKEGSARDFFVCGQDGKKKCRYKNKETELNRGSILENAEMDDSKRPTHIVSLQTAID